MILHLSDLSAEPLHVQIFGRIRAEILAGRLAAGDALPAVRVLAKEAKVSVRSVRRAYDDLEAEGWLEPGDGGPRVAAVPEERRRAVGREALADGIGRVVGDPAVESLGEGEIRRVLREILGKANHE